MEWLAPEGLGYRIEQAVEGVWPQAPETAPGVIRIGVHASGSRPTEGFGAYDLLLTSDPFAPTPWVAVPEGVLHQRVQELVAAIRLQPAAASTAAQILRMTQNLPLDQALALESLGYSMLLASAGFRAWRAATPARPARGDQKRVIVWRQAGVMCIRLARPDSRNAFDAAMRDQLVEALEFARDDPETSPVRLDGEGACFSAGGDLDEFGSATDPAVAHAIRLQQAPVRLLAALGDRLTVQLHGACIGAGIELPAAAARVVATPNTFFRLPEVSMGLIPGAGGTATLPRRVGRWRTCYMALSGARIDAGQALEWGLIDAVLETPDTSA